MRSRTPGFLDNKIRFNVAEESHCARNIHIFQNLHCIYSGWRTHVCGSVHVEFRDLQGLGFSLYM